MAKTLFPFLAPPAAQAAARELPLLREVAWDYGADRPVFRGGVPVLVEGLEAVRVWACHALRTARYQFEGYSFGHGSELQALVGQPYTGDTKQAEGARNVRDALLASPYITEAEVTEAAYTGSTVTLCCRISSVYGEVSVDVRG